MLAYMMLLSPDIMRTKLILQKHTEQKKKHENNVLHYKKLNNNIESRQRIVLEISKTLCHQFKGQETIALLHKFIR